MPSTVTEAPESPITAAEESRQMAAEIADGLHALAQPLTILRSAIEMIGVCRRSGGNWERYHELSAENINRACEQFAAIQGLVRTRLQPARSETVDCAAIISRLVEEKNIALEGRGIGIAAAIPGSLQAVAGDSARVEEAISATIDAAISISASGDVVQLQVLEAEQFVETRVQTTRLEKVTLPAAVRLELSLAKADILSQQGHYSFASEPFSVSLALPISTHRKRREHSAHD
jgi:hypothetical protein